MKRKRITNPLAEIALALVLLVVIGFAVRSCVNRNNKEQAQINEMLEYHSAPNQLVVEHDGYIKIIKQ